MTNVDKCLKYHDLLQEFYRINRVENRQNKHRIYAYSDFEDDKRNQEIEEFSKKEEINIKDY